MNAALESAARWEQLATVADESAVYEESRGSSGQPQRNKANTYRQTAKALRLEAETGIPHCACCLKPQGAKS